MSTYFRTGPGSQLSTHPTLNSFRQCPMFLVHHTRQLNPTRYASSQNRAKPLPGMKNWNADKRVQAGLEASMVSPADRITRPADPAKQPSPSCSFRHSNWGCGPSSVVLTPPSSVVCPNPPWGSVLCFLCTIRVNCVTRVMQPHQEVLNLSRHEGL